MEYEKIDLDTWERKDSFLFYSKISHPFYVCAFRQDVTGVYAFAKRHGVSFYYSLVWACTMALNDIDAFRTVIVDGVPCRIACRHPSFTDLRKGSEQFHIVTMKYDRDPLRFAELAKKTSLAQKTFIEQDEESEDLVYFTCLPWIDMTALTNERDIKEGYANSSIPQIAWGKYTEENGRKTLGMSMEVNHRFIDGLNIGRFSEKLAEYISILENS
ncbi:MAG: chloramphenicol acetyltransferase [Clostridia bacterium]|nr:chloramphenicol acetyltransferase [Clostridia bacterium]